LTPKTCDDGNACTLDGCDSASGCTHANAKDSSPCVESKSCQVQQTCLAGKCQGGQDKLFVKSLSNGTLGTIQTVQALASGGSIASGGFGNDSCFVKRLDAAGVAVWEKTFMCSSPSAVPAALVNGGTAIWQVSGNAPGCCPSGEVRAFSVTDGNSIWKRKVVGPSDCIAIAAHPAGGAVIGCTSGITFRTDGSPAELSQSTAIWWNQLGASDAIRAVKVLPNGHVISAGRLNGVGFVQQLDDKGGLVWKTALTQVACNLIDGISILADGGILAFGQGGSGTVGSFHRLDKAGNVILSKGFPNCGNYGCFHDAVEIGNGQILVVGAQDGSAALRWMNSNGDTLAMKKWSLGKNSIFWDIEPVGTSGYLLGGEYIQSLLRIDNFGNDSCVFAGTCVGKALNDCDDKNPCTFDTCDGAKGCIQVNLADNAACGVSGTCQSGACKL
jgi:outer membrane protein assembly factor BamB